ncbi:hypothetical protein ACIQI7_12600 [Kitasatospora sp. NPDC092039]|uniref:hypothetical protein n=1 Tax=Kitasatospora sp. NPDC092039 TaxID=3364086 RepID=UPI0037F93569
MIKSRTRTILLAGASGTLLACIGLASLSTAQATAGAAATAAETDMPTAVEDFQYPEADRILTERKITLKRGDGRILLKEGPGHTVPTSCQAGNEIFVESRLDRLGYCFTVSGTTGYLTMELPDAYGIWTEDRSVSAKLVAAGQEKQVNIGPNSVEPVGESLPGGKRSVLVELRITG